jgi:hypothetical protein
MAAALQCRVCGCSMRIKAIQDRCPKCGTATSAPTNLLLDCDPGWLGRMGRGASWLAVGIGLETITSLLGIVLVFVVSMNLMKAAVNTNNSQFVPAATTAGGQSALRLLGSVRLILGTITLIGLWKVTSPEPGRPIVIAFGFRAFVCLVCIVQCVLAAAAMAVLFTRPYLGMPLLAAVGLLAAAVFSALASRAGRGAKALSTGV